MRLVRDGDVPVGAVVNLEGDFLSPDGDQQRLIAVGRPNVCLDILNAFAVHREVGDDARPIAHDGAGALRGLHLEGAAEAAGDIAGRLHGVGGVVGEYHLVSPEGPRREADVSRHAVVAAGAMAQSADGDRRFVLHARLSVAAPDSRFSSDRNALCGRPGGFGMDLTERRVLITGGAGLIGPNLARRLRDHHDADVIVADDLSKGRRERVPDGVEFIEADFTDEADVARAVTADLDVVFHLAAYTDTNFGEPRRLFEENTEMTYNLLERMAEVDVRNLAFTSSSTVYGEAPRPTPEDYAPLEPISIYGSSKLADESLLSTYAHSNDFSVWCFRFANIVGPGQRGTVIPDFIEKLQDDPESLTILGDGRQEKSYLHATECVEAMCHVVEHADASLNTYNLGTRTTTSVTTIADIVADEMGLDPDYEFTGGDRGWTGDVPRMRLSIEKLSALGWEPSLSSHEAVERAAEELVAEMT